MSLLALKDSIVMRSLDSAFATQAFATKSGVDKVRLYLFVCSFVCFKTNKAFMKIQTVLIQASRISLSYWLVRLTFSRKVESSGLRDWMICIVFILSSKCSSILTVFKCLYY